MTALPPERSPKRLGYVVILFSAVYLTPTWITPPSGGRLAGGLVTLLGLGVGLLLGLSERRNRVCVQFRLIAGEASTSLICSSRHPLEVHFVFQLNRKLVLVPLPWYCSLECW